MALHLNLTAILTDLADIYKNAATSDGYGQPTSLGSVQVGAAVACRLLPWKLGNSREFKTEKKVTISQYVLYMMPFVDAGTPLNEHYWVVINGTKYNVIEVLNPVIVGAPCEIALERVKP
jgi:hypothetical protein